MSKVIFEIELTPENASLVQAVSALVTDAGEKKATVEGLNARSLEGMSKTEPGTSPTADDLPKPKYDLNDLKKAGKEAAKEHGEEFALSVMRDAGVQVTATLGRSFAKVELNKYAEIIGAWVDGPTEVVEDEPVSPEKEVDELDELDTPESDAFDDFDDEEDTAATVDPDAVKVAFRAYAKSNGRDAAKKILDDHGVKNLAALDSADQATLAKLLKAAI